MDNYIDAFAMPISRDHLLEYQKVAERVAKIWKEHGALAYFEYLGDDLTTEGTHSFLKALEAKADETIIFGWVVFESREIRDQANALVAADPRMEALVAPLMNPSRTIFDAKRMAYGGFKSFINR